MTLRLLDSSSNDLGRFLDALSRRRGDDGGSVNRDVVRIIDAVRRRGDRALVEFTRKFDGISLTATNLRVPRWSWPRRSTRCPTWIGARSNSLQNGSPSFIGTRSKYFSYRDRYGMRLGQMVRPLDRVGIYVPGGMGAYPSSVLMNAIPARVAGVRELSWFRRHQNRRSRRRVGGGCDCWR